MSTSRRIFLKRTMAGASVALGGLQNLAMTSSSPTGTADLQAGLSGELSGRSWRIPTRAASSRG
jgi:hypothetical protein